MKNLYQDPVTNDLTLTAFNLQMTGDTAEWLTAKIQNRLRFFQGEWFLNREVGIPYFQKVFKKETDINEVNALFVTQITGTPGVAELLAFSSSFDGTTRRYSVSFSVRATDGQTVAGVSII